jgi:hypothetical protein
LIVEPFGINVRPAWRDALDCVVRAVSVVLLWTNIDLGRHLTVVAPAEADLVRRCHWQRAVQLGERVLGRGVEVPMVVPVVVEHATCRSRGGDGIRRPLVLPVIVGIVVKDLGSVPLTGWAGPQAVRVGLHRTHTRVRDDGGEP